MNDTTGKELWVLGDRYCILHQDETYAIVAVAGTEGHGPPPHRHHRETESIYVTDGELEVELEGVRHRVCAGEFLHLPVGQTHSYTTRSATSRHLTIIVPGRFAEMFLAIGHARREEVDLAADAARLRALAPAYGLQIIAAAKPAGIPG